MLLPGREWQEGYRFGFGGKEICYIDQGESVYLDFGARYYNSRLGRWFAADHESKTYPFISPYAYAVNTPIRAIDPDGNLVVFVNGFRLTAYKTFLKSRLVPWWERKLLGIKDTPPWEHKEKIFSNDTYDYWYGNDANGNRSSNISDRIDYKFETRFQDFNSVYVDGMYTPYSNAQDRYDRGVADGKALVEAINSGEVKLGLEETIKIVGHSHGGWHGRGMADYLVSQGFTVEGYYALRPHQPNQKVERIDGWEEHDYFSAQYSIKSDHVSSDQSKLGVGDVLVGDSKFARMQDIDEMPTLPEMSNADLGGHDVQDASNIFEIPSNQEGYVRPDGYCPNDRPCE